jgi:transcriptional regulator with XRE-family HTH domain
MPKGQAVSAEEQLQLLLRQMRTEAGLTQTEIAQRLGQPQSFVSKYESGERRLDVLELREVCAVVGVSLADFVRRLEQTLL